MDNTAINLSEFEQYTHKPYFKCDRSGVHYIAVETDKDGSITEKPPLKLSDPIELIGRGIDQAGNHYRIISYRDNITRRIHQTALPMAEIGNTWAGLQGMGIAIMSGWRKRNLLADYLQTEGNQTPYTVTNQSGWQANNQAYILPNGDMITNSKEPTRIIYNGDKSQAAAYTSRGTLEQWQQEIAVYMQNNSRLSLAIGTALAAPLVSLLNLEAGGFHLYGDSRDGKSTAVKAALSVWGNPTDLMLTWTGTGLGFNNIANARNDGLLVLDEIGQANAKHVSMTAYSVINGISKIQGAKEGGNRESSRWRILLLSTGEKPLDSFLHANNADWNAGQAARLPSIPSDAGKGLGIYDTLHNNHIKGSEQSEAINAAAQQYHGTAGRAFIHYLLEQPQTIAKAQDYITTFLKTLPPLDGQALTVARRFALIYAAIQTAIDGGILPSQIEPLPSIKQCFNAWKERTGLGKYEDSHIIKQAVDFMQRHGNSTRFTNWESKYTSNDHAGYYRLSERESLDEYWIIPAVFDEEIAQTYETAKVCTVLHGINWLKKPNERGWQHKRYGKGRFYVLIGVTPPETDDI